MKAKISTTIAVCIGGLVIASMSTPARAKGPGYRTVRRPSAASAGVKRVSTTIFSANQLSAMALAKSRRQANWVANSATPNAHAGPWNKGNLRHFPNPPRSVARPDNAGSGVKKGVCANLTQYALRLGVYQGHGSSYQANLAAVRHFERNNFRRAPSASAAPPKPAQPVQPATATK